MELATKNDWVEIENLILSPEERAPQLPEDTKAVPLKMWVKGFLLDEEAKIGDEVSIRTLTDRITKGILVAVKPRHIHDFGEPEPCLLTIGMEVRKELGNL
ncbi:2-amino-4-oxopentanoate thiolase subunit OrtA [Alkaliphilus oremlandii]|uniref:2-amino-4-ketopentanoate thiolase n=1 Tax=Alkaliphilus oremlandii (strain OhILAs) TaxID=350688 RepID=A8MKM3_ALKOO|nr:2-amino-4-oxopentanoate thiolase subunit OrtA [Alkaliphilus oremlandii]ABW20355.1 conserved hypothetical protein [Alkaliphilus oremlandii OhILAs]